MEFISERISVERGPGTMSVVITARLSSMQRALLLAWATAWTFCGAYFVYELVETDKPDLRKGLIIMLAFWAYFAFGVVRTLLWRLKGFELWRIKDGTFTVKHSVLRYGKATDYFIANMKGFGTLNIDMDSWKWQLNDSFWTRGAERIGFEHLGKKIAIGRGITEAEARDLSKVVAEGLKRARKVEGQ